ncbi:MAG: hypothetical protein PHT58_07835 [Eubacteriales bacterium]|nr:hypothetical protein [Eubacteriales bacterium]
MNRLFYMDELNKTLLVTGLISLLLRFLFPKVAWLYYALLIVAVACLIFFVIRMVYASNTDKRARENRTFAAAFAGIKNFFTGRNKNGHKRAKVVNTSKDSGGGTPKKNKRTLAQRWNERKSHRYLVCPQCHQKLRVPRGKGKIKVTCTMCKNQFIAKS